LFDENKADPLLKTEAFLVFSDMELLILPCPLPLLRHKVFSVSN